MKNNEQNGWSIDLWDVLKCFWRYKILLVLIPVITFMAMSLYMHYTLIPEYRTSLWCRLPQYTDDRTINTAVSVANGDVKEELFNQLQTTNSTIAIGVSRVPNTSVISISFTGTDPQLIKEASDTFEGIFVSKANGFVNEAVKKDLLIAELNGGTALTGNAVFDNRDALSSVEVIKKGQLPTAVINKDASRSLILNCTVISELVICVIVVLRYLYNLCLGRRMARE